MVFRGTNWYESFCRSYFHSIQIMSAIDELCALGFEKYWVNHALQLTNNNQEEALAWLLSDEYKEAKAQFDQQRLQYQQNKPQNDITERLSHASHFQCVCYIPYYIFHFDYRYIIINANLLFWLY